MKVPAGMTFHAAGGPYEEGDDIPEDILARLPDDHPLKAQAPTARAVRPTAKD